MPLSRDDSVALSIHTSGDTAAILDYLSQNGVSPRHAGDHYIEVFLPLRLLTETAKLPGIVSIDPVIPPRPFQTPTQNVSGNGPAVHGSTPWNNAGFTGKGVKIGVIDVGFKGATALLGTELPHNPEVRCYGTESDELLSLAECDRSIHGTIVAESVIDIAPEATLYLASIRSKGDLADIVDWMIDEDISVINISLGWTFDGPGDGTSPQRYSPLNTLIKAVDSGIVWISAAGNQGLSSWFGAPTDTDSDGVLELGGTEQLKLNSGGPHLVQLRWQGNWNAETQDLDLHVYDDNGNAVAQGLNPQKGEPGQRPHEIARPETKNSIVQVTSAGDTLPSWIQVVAWGALMGETTQTGSISTPADSPNTGAAAVGAMNWNRVHDIEGYSSKGPTPDGRTKPDLVAAACGETAHKGPGEIFCGTSQAAPHVAAIAALVRQRFPQLTPQEVIQYLSEHAEERGEPGKDNHWGAGLSVLPSLPTPTPSPTPVTTPTPVPPATATPTPTPTPEPNRDRQALEALYKATDGDNWRFNANWLTNQPLNLWDGIRLDRDGRIISIRLKRNNMHGTIPSELTNLPSLQKLILSENDLTGTVPPELGDLANLTVLDLNFNQLSGEIPPELGNLTNLQHMKLRGNALIGQLPPTLIRIAGLQNFEFAYNAGLCTPPEPAFQSWLQSIPNSDTVPKCRDDGQRIAFVSYRDGNNEIYLMDSDSTNRQNLTNHPASDQSPAWSPDGQRIAFVTDRDGDSELYVINADGTDLTRLNNNSYQTYSRDHSPSWSPEIASQP